MVGGDAPVGVSKGLSRPLVTRALAEAREAVRAGDVVYGTEAVRALVKGRLAS